METFDLQFQFETLVLHIAVYTSKHTVTDLFIGLSERIKQRIVFYNVRLFPEFSSAVVSDSYFLYSVAWVSVC